MYNLTRYFSFNQLKKVIFLWVSLSIQFQMNIVVVLITTVWILGFYFDKNLFCKTQTKLYK